MAGVVLSVLGAYYPTHGERDSQLDHGGSAQHCAAAVCVRVVEMSDARSQPADCDVIVCYGGAKLTDKHLASTVHCVDDEIIEWLKRRELRRLACSWQSAYKYLP
jgi:hypothetical protein